MLEERPLVTDIILAFSNRSLDNMSLCYGDTVNSLKNREVFLGQLGLEYRDLVCAKQIHADRVAYVAEKDRGRGALSYETSVADTDAFVTDKKNVPLAIFTADCLSIFLHDVKNPAIGLIHAGWRSTKENISAKTITLMQERFSSRPQDLCVNFGPCIRSCCYEVGSDFKEIFPSGVAQRNDRYYLDLIAINKEQLLGLGVKKNNMSDSEVCTCCLNKEFFSYRREGQACGRMMSVAMMR